MFQCCLHIISTVPLLFTGLVVCGPRCYIAVHFGSSTWSELSHFYLIVWLFVIQLSHCHTHRWLYVISILHFSLEWCSVVSGFPLLLTLIASNCNSCFTAHHLGSFVSSQGFHFCSLGWLCIFTDVSQQLTKRGLQCFMCHIVIHLGDSAWSVMSNCCLPWWLCDLPGVPLSISGVAQCHSRSHCP